MNKKYRSKVSVGVFMMLWSMALAGFVSAQDAIPLVPQDESVAAVKDRPSAPPQEYSAQDTQPILNIKRVTGEDALFSIELRDIELADFFRVVARDYRLNIVLEKDIRDRVSASFTNISLEEAVAKIAEIYNLSVENRGKIIFIRPNIITKKFILKNINAEDLLRGPSQSGAVASNAAAGQEQTAVEQPTVMSNRVGTIYDLLSDRGKILTGSQPNIVIVMDYPPNISRLEEFISLMDKRVAMKVFKLKYLSVKELFPQLETDDAARRTGQRAERDAERGEIKGLSAGATAGTKK